jgi:hypothetical protein
MVHYRIDLNSLFFLRHHVPSDYRHKKPSQIALGGFRVLIFYFSALEFKELLEFLFGLFMNQKANWKVENRNDPVAEPSHHYYFKNIGLDIWNPFVLVQNKACH